jgi:hypothetical protein
VRITKSQLRRIIKEELNYVLNEERDWISKLRATMRRMDPREKTRASQEIAYLLHDQAKTLIAAGPFHEVPQNVPGYGDRGERLAGEIKQTLARAKKLADQADVVGLDIYQWAEQIFGYYLDPAPNAPAGKEEEALALGAKMSARDLQGFVETLEDDFAGFFGIRL